MMAELLGARELTTLHAVLCVIGIVMSVWCHQLWGRELFGWESPQVVRLIQRASFIALALSLTWSLSYVNTLQWTPWPSYAATIAAVDFFLFSFLLAAAYRGRFTG